MRWVYLTVVYVHIVSAAIWFGAMLFEDPRSTRFAARLAYKIHGLGGVSLLFLTLTGILLLYLRGLTLTAVLSADFLATRTGQVLAGKVGVVLFLIALQATVGNRPSRALYGYLLAVLVVIGLSVWLVRPIV
jgi:hypothetical protein